MQTKGSFRKANFDEALTLLSKRGKRKGVTQANSKMFRGKKKLWEGDEYEKTTKLDDDGKTRHLKKDKPVTLPKIQFLNRRLDGET